jgi:predicted nucleic acid-binding protein
VIVADASALVVAASEDSERADDVLERLRVHVLAPVIVDAEVGQAVRGMVLRHELDAGEGWEVLGLARRLVAERHGVDGLIERAWELRDNVSVYDALYVALAELHDLPLLTADARLATVPRVRCQFELV